MKGMHTTINVALVIIFAFAGTQCQKWDGFTFIPKTKIEWAYKYMSELNVEKALPLINEAVAENPDSKLAKELQNVIKSTADVTKQMRAGNHYSREFQKLTINSLFYAIFEKYKDWKMAEVCMRKALAIDLETIEKENVKYLGYPNEHYKNYRTLFKTGLANTLYYQERYVEAKKILDNINAQKLSEDNRYLFYSLNSKVAQALGNEDEANANFKKAQALKKQPLSDEEKTEKMLQSWMMLEQFMGVLFQHN